MDRLMYLGRWQDASGTTSCNDPTRQHHEACNDIATTAAKQGTTNTNEGNTVHFWLDEVSRCGKPAKGQAIQHSANVIGFEPSDHPQERHRSVSVDF